MVQQNNAGTTVEHPKKILCVSIAEVVPTARGQGGKSMQTHMSVILMNGVSTRNWQHVNSPSHMGYRDLGALKAIL
ncbi:MAG TPA: hypothetical protein VMH03_07430 [Terriglobales bacterium]|nr:hypothetical protein [Terriglobales bacterium]